MVVQNGSFNCNAAKVLVTAKGWEQRDEFLAAVREALAEASPRKAYYPGAQQRYEAFVSHYDYQSSHMAPGNVTPDDVLDGRREQIPQRRGEVQTVERHRRYDRTLRQLARCST